MSQENVEIVRRAWTSFIETHEILGGVHAPDWVWDMRTFRGWPREVVTTGTDEFMEFFEDWIGPYNEWTTELENIHDAGDAGVVVVVKQEGRIEAAAWVTLRIGVIYTVETGLIRRARAYETPEEALDAAGLSAN